MVKKEPTLLFLSISDSDYADAKWKRIKIENDAWSWDDVGDADGNTISSRSISETDFNASLNEFKNRAKAFLSKNADLPSHYDNGVASINAIDTSGITFPVTAKNWVKACVDNSITLPFIREVH